MDQQAPQAGCTCTAHLIFSCKRGTAEECIPCIRLTDAVCMQDEGKVITRYLFVLQSHSAYNVRGGDVATHAERLARQDHMWQDVALTVPALQLPRPVPAAMPLGASVASGKLCARVVTPEVQAGPHATGRGANSACAPAAEAGACSHAPRRLSRLRQASKALV